jgi:hypothetical protein
MRSAPSRQMTNVATLSLLRSHVARSAALAITVPGAPSTAAISFGPT